MIDDEINEEWFNRKFNMKLLQFYDELHTELTKYINWITDLDLG